MLRVEELRFRYGKRGGEVLRGVSLTLGEGEIGVLLGKNGAGKTTLLECLLGIRRPQSGRVFFRGEDLLAMKQRERARRVAYVPQNIRFGALTVFDSVLLGRVSRFGSRCGEEDRRCTRRVLEEMGLEDFASRNVEELSGGERQKVAVARALAQEPQLLIFDEPTGNLDIANEILILREAARLAREKGIGVLTSLHDLDRALAFGDRFYLMKDGVVKYHAAREEVSGDMLGDVFGVRVRIAALEDRKIVLTD